MERFQSRGAAVLLPLLGLVLFGLAVVFIPTFSGFAAAVFKGALVIALGVAFDAFVLRESDTLTEIVRKGNVAYAVFFGLVIVAIGIAVSTA